MTDETKPAKWRVVIAFILDLIFSFFAIGYLVALIFGGTTETGFALSGFPALIAIALWIAYMAMMPRYGGRLFQRIFKTI